MSTPAQDLVADLISQVFPPSGIIGVHKGDSKLSPEGSGTGFVEVHDIAPWPGSTGVNRRVIQLSIYGDVSRDEFNNPIKADADSLCWGIWKVADEVLREKNDESGILTSRRANGPSLTLIPNGDGAVLLTAQYEISFI